MLLTRIVAERFGRLESVTLGDLSGGLNVVLGPNEAGKTSFTTLVRYVLYGFPTKRAAEPAYESSAGKRVGRLVFTDDAGEWAIERVEGSHGGPVAVHAMSGPDRPDLDKTITSGITRDAFRVVFGFGLAEMAMIEAERGAGLDILSRLYAAQTGLAVSPADVRQSIATQKSGLWLKSGQNPTLNEIKAAIAACKSRITVLEGAASEFARDREQLALLARRLHEARTVRDQAARRAAELSAAVQELDELQTRAQELDETVAENQAEFDAMNDALTRIAIDENVLSVVADLKAALDDLSAFKQGFERSVVLEPQIAQVRHRALAALQAASTHEAAATSADLGPETIAGAKRWSTTLAGLESQRVTSERAADTTADAAAASGARSGSAFGGGAGWVPGALMAALGALICAWGIIGSDYVQAVLGVLVLGTGVALLWRLRSLTRPGAERSPVLSAAVQAARGAAERDARALQTARGEWHTWLVERGLDGAGDDPEAVSLLIDAFRDYRSAASEADRLTQARETEIGACEEYRARLAAAAGSVAPDLATIPLADVATRAVRLRETLQATLEAERTRHELTAGAERAQRAVTDARDKAAAVRVKITALFASMGLQDADAAHLAAEHALAVQSADVSARACEDVLTEHTKLATRLDAEGRDSQMAELRLELTGLEARRSAALDRYSVLAVAEGLMARTQAYNEQARQPAVVRRASELFETITAGRYMRVAVPSEGGEFVVYDPDSEPTPSSQLSTGAAQQLYLAVRIALIETLDDKGPGLPVLMDDVFANFDPERKLGAARAVAELAAHRQVVMFTCHPETAALFNVVDPAHAVITLDRCV